MRSTIAVFLLMTVVVWDMAQNNGYMIRTVANHVADGLRAVGLV